MDQCRIFKVRAESILDLECAYEETSEEFCEYVLDAYEANTEAISVLKPNRTFFGDKRTLRGANRLIRVLLRKTELTDVLIAVEKVLEADLNALVELKAHCSDGSLEETERTRCKEAGDHPGDAPEELVHAITKLPLEQNSTLAKEADEAYLQFGGFYQGTLRQQHSDAALTLGNKVLETLTNQIKAVEARSD
ncbi:hypothetical protein Q1695_004368 [Nippostrongylus brasiliensis]|nr:hypothetical protein Q1695_004368 [Nippostrongylus brasiliensis]